LSEKEALAIAINFAKTLGANTNDLKVCTHSITPKTIQFEELEILCEMNNDQIIDRFKEVFSSPFSLSFSFLHDRDYYLEIENHNIDLEFLDKFYQMLDKKIGEEKLSDILNDVSRNFFKAVKFDNNQIEDPWIFRSLLIMMQNHILFNPK